MRRASLILLSIACGACAARTLASGVAYRKQVIFSTPVHVVCADLNNPDVKVTVAISKGGRGSSEPASSIVSRSRPAAAITGTFFDTRTLLPTGDIGILGVMIHSGCVGPALCVTSENAAQIVPGKYRTRWQAGNYETVLAGGPTLVQNGRIALNPRAEGFYGRSILRPSRRTAAGLTPHGKLLLVCVNRPITLRHLARIMLGLGCKQAMLLDGGSSTTLYANGRFIAWPARRLTNLLLVYDSAQSYRQAEKQLAPPVLLAKRPQPAASTPNLLAPPPAPEPWYRRLALAPDLPYPSTGSGRGAGTGTYFSSGR